MTKPFKYTHKETLFIKEYLVDQNGVRSVMNAGYTKNPGSAGQMAYRLLKKVHIRSAIRRELKKREDKVQFRADDVLLRLKNISDVDVARCFKKNGDLKSIHQIPVAIRKSIASIDVVCEYQKVNGKKKVVGYTKKIRFWDKNRALELTGKHLKLFTDKLEHAGPDGKPLQPAAAPQVVIMLPPKESKE